MDRIKKLVFLRATTLRLALPLTLDNLAPGRKPAATVMVISMGLKIVRAGEYKNEEGEKVEERQRKGTVALTLVLLSRGHLLSKPLPLLHSPLVGLRRYS